MKDEEDSGLKKPNAISSYDLYRKKEMLKCIQDPMYFIQNYVIVNEPSVGDVLFNLYPYQKDIIKGFYEHKKVILMCGRQQGKCVTYDTKITKNGEDKKIGDLVKLSFKQKIVNKLENILLKLSK